MGFIGRPVRNQTELPLGRHPKTGEPFVASEVDRFSGTYLLGVQGSGKSSEMRNLILEDIKKGHAVVVIDPHLDLANGCVASLPAEHLARTYVLDVLDEDYPFGINLFGLSGKPRSAKERSQAADRVMHVLKTLWPEVDGHQNLPLYVQSAAIALVNRPGMTLLHMSQFLTDKPFRDALLKDVRDPMVHDHWRQYDQLKSTDQDTRLNPLMTRLKGIFMGHELIQNILGQPTTVSFRRAIENREIIFIKLPIKEMEQECKLLGMVIVAQVSAALFSFVDLPEHERPGFSLYVDEFQNFSTPDFAHMFTEGRKFGMRVTLAHQVRGQLTKELRDATGGARTKICFQLKADDAREMAEYFPTPDVDAHVTATLLDDPGDDPRVRAFTNAYLRPLQSQRKAGKVKIAQPGLNMWHVVVDGYEVAKKLARESKPPEVEDPTQYVDDLLRDVLQTHNPNLPIPREAVIGFANCGHGFYRALKKLGPELAADYQFPASGRWRHAPWGGREQLLHCIFTLRQAMYALAAQPISKKGQATTASVAQQLTQLPKRHALVRSGDDVGHIYTYDTPPLLEGRALQERMRLIQAQTRAKYCHALSQVQRVMAAEPDPAAAGVPEIAGWGEVGEP